MTSMASLCQFLYIYIYTYVCIVKCVYGILVPQGPTAVNDVIEQCVNITSSMKLRNTKLCVVGHYFCCTIP